MKIRFPIALSLPVIAHDPKLHQHQGAAAPDCSQMKDIDMSKMDPNDPVMKAMHKKCKNQMKHDAMQGDMNDVSGMEKKTPPPTDKDKQ